VEADFEETDPDSPSLLISRLVCSLAGVAQTVTIAPDSRAAKAYGSLDTVEQFTCSYGLNPRLQEGLDWGQFEITGCDEDGAARIMELDGHPFYVGTLFLPQLSSTPEKPHPLVLALLKVAA
jgi:CTP synthase (UTP-ammonia lyase)